VSSRLDEASPVVYPPCMHDPLAAKYAQLVDPGIRRFMIEGERFYPPDAVNFTLAEQRAFYDRYCAHFGKPRPPSVTLHDFNAGSVPCRLYKSDATPRPPVLLYLHGGGFVLGSLDSHDDVCAEICEGADIAVVAVQYRLSPVKIFPAAFDDCWSALKHVAETELGVDRAKIIVGGDSAGGNLAAALAMKARDEGAPKLLGQVLIYPGLGGDTSKGSYVAQATAPGLTVADIDYYRRLYCGPDGSPGHRSKYAAPLRETDYRSLPPAFMVAAALDPLHDDCGDYAARLQAAGVPALVRDEPLLVHAFIRARHMSEPARESFSAIVEACFVLAYHGELPEQDADPR
jgi:acetyl esterase